MNSPIKFPSDADVIIEEAQRFRALSPADRMRVIRGLLNAADLMLNRSPKAAFIREQMLEEKNSARQAVKEFILRHVRSE
jgi:hypothetical protein